MSLGPGVDRGCRANPSPNRLVRTVVSPDQAGVQRTRMPGPKVRADYDALKNVAQGFSQQADETAKSLQSLQGQMETLQGGDWVGQGATAFYAEMNDQVLPTIKRLQSALQNSADITQKISQAMKTAE